MEKINEDFKVIVRELSQVNKVKDLKFGLNTSQSGKAEFITKRINGVIDGIYIASDSRISVKIWIDGWDEDVLYDNVSYVGSRYIPLRVNSIDKNNERFNFNPVSWAINNRLRFVVKGGFNAQVNFVLRYR